MMVEDQRVAHYGLIETNGRCLGVFYAYDGMVISRDSEWLQHMMNFLVGLFRRYGLASNVAKSCKMTCQTDAIQAGLSEEDMALKCMGMEDLYQVRL